jgi:nicotinic acid phosphoribosyltransferase
MRRTHRLLAGTGLVVAAGIGGAFAPGLFSAGAATTTTTTTAMPAHGTAAHEDSEKAVTGASAAMAQAAAVASVGSGTAGAVTTDHTGTGYEVTVTKPDGSTVEVHLDSSFTVVQGFGGPPPAH